MVAMWHRVDIPITIFVKAVCHLSISAGRKTDSYWHPIKWRNTYQLTCERGGMWWILAIFAGWLSDVCLVSHQSSSFPQIRERGERLPPRPWPRLISVTSPRSEASPAVRPRPISGQSWLVTDQWRGRIWRAINQCRAWSGQSGTDEVGGQRLLAHTDTISTWYFKTIILVHYIKIIQQHIRLLIFVHIKIFVLS